MKIAIVGTAPATCDLAPFNDPSWDMWTLGFRDVKRSNALFEMHARSKWVFHASKDYPERLAKATAPVYLLEAQPDIPTGIVYPYAEVKADLSPPGAECDFFTSSLAYMMALAVHQASDRMRHALGVAEIEEIGLFGVDMAAEEEYAYQRPAMMYLVALARGRGIKVTVPPNSPLLKANFVYGDHLSSDAAFQQATGITEAFLDGRVARYDEDRTRTAARLRDGEGLLQRIDGALGEARTLLAEKEITRELLEANVARYEADRAKVAESVNEVIARMNTLDGTLAEARALRQQVVHFNRGGVIA